VIDNGEFKGKSGDGQFLKRGECVAIGKTDDHVDEKSIRRRAESTGKGN